MLMFILDSDIFRMNLSLVALLSTVQLLRRPSMLVTRKWPPQTSSSAFSLSSSLSEAKSDRVEEKLNEDDWFKKIVKPTSGEVASDDVGISSTHETILKRVSGDGPVIKKRFNELEGEEKRKYIVAYYEASKEQGERVPKQLTEKYMEVLMRSETYSHFRRSLQFLMKEDYYTEKREYRKKLLAERRKAMEEARLNAVPGEPPTNYPGHYTYIHRIDTQTFRTFYQSRVLSSIRNNEPSVVFDFRFISQHTRLERIKSLYRQFAEIISRNRESPVPFQMHFCNYERDTEFHTKFGNSLAIDRNMILDSPKNYLETFDRERLVYLSSDAPRRMTSYDPNKTYIIGAMIDMNPGEFEYYSYAQAKKDRIVAERLPLEIYPDWKKSKKNLNIDKVFNILLNLKHGGNWEDSFRENLPGSSYFLKKKQQEKNTDDDF